MCRRHGGAITLILVATMGTMTSVASAMPDPTPSYPPPPRIAHAPLWQLVPSKHFAILGEGTVRNLRWGVYVFRGPGKEGGTRPCIFEVDLWYDGGFSSGSACGPLSPPGYSPVYTMTSFGTKRASGAVLAMTLGTEIARAKVDFGPGPVQTRRVYSLSSAQARKARVRPFNYLAFDLAHDVTCLEGVTGYGTAGETLLEPTPYDCTGVVGETPSTHP